MTSRKQIVTAIPAQVTRFRPFRLVEVELSQLLPEISACDPATGRNYDRALILVRLHSQPIGILELTIDGINLDSATYAQAVFDQLGAAINEHLRADGLPEIIALPPEGIRNANQPACLQARDAWLATAPRVSVIIATHNRTDSLSKCLQAILASEYPDFEIVVVDNAPKNDDTLDYIRANFGESGRVRYVRENRPGLGRAHNAGLKVVDTDIVVFTDDDVIVDRFWLLEMVKGFSMADNVGCVTGLIIPAELETEAQLWIEQYSGFSKGFKRRVFNLHTHRVPGVLYPYTAGVFGSGASMAFTMQALRDIGGFDPALGAGTVALGGDDLDAFFQVVTKGYNLVYEPAAILRHSHRREYAGLQRQAYGYGVGLTAYLTKTIMNEPQRLLDLLIAFPSGVAHILSPTSPKNNRKQTDYPRELNWLERKGMLYGPIAYWRSRRIAKD